MKIRHNIPDVRPTLPLPYTSGEWHIDLRMPHTGLANTLLTWVFLQPQIYASCLRGPQEPF